jgi:hypothetical protein
MQKCESPRRLGYGQRGQVAPQSDAGRWSRADGNRTRGPAWYCCSRRGATASRPLATHLLLLRHGRHISGAELSMPSGATFPDTLVPWNPLRRHCKAGFQSAGQPRGIRRTRTCLRTQEAPLRAAFARLGRWFFAFGLPASAEIFTEPRSDGRKPAWDEEEPRAYHPFGPAQAELPLAFEPNLPPTIRPGADPGRAPNTPAQSGSAIHWSRSDRRWPRAVAATRMCTLRGLWPTGWRLRPIFEGCGQGPTEPCSRPWARGRH